MRFTRAEVEVASRLLLNPDFKKLMIFFDEQATRENQAFIYAKADERAVRQGRTQVMAEIMDAVYSAPTKLKNYEDVDK